MKKIIIAGLAIAMCMGVFSGKALSAAKSPEFGARLGLVHCSGCNGSLQIGGDYFIPVTDKDDVDVRLTYSSESSVDILSLSGNYIYNLPMQAKQTGNWYVGAGLGVTRLSTDIFGASRSTTKLGLNLMGGYKFSNKVSAEATYTGISGDDFFGISVGYRFN